MYSGLVGPNILKGIGFDILAQCLRETLITKAPPSLAELPVNQGCYYSNGNRCLHLH